MVEVSIGLASESFADQFHSNMTPHHLAFMFTSAATTTTAYVESGVLRDHMGKILCVFSCHMGTQDVILAELLAILRACELFGSNSEFVSRPITIISDSKTAVSWISRCIPRNNSHDQVISNIRSWLDSFYLAAVEFRPRSTNSYADTLAKKGVQLGTDELWWSVLIWHVLSFLFCLLVFRVFRCCCPLFFLVFWVFVLLVGCVVWLPFVGCFVVVCLAWCLCFFDCL